MKKLNLNGLPNGTTKLLISQLKKAARNKMYALTESIDDAIDAVNNSSASKIEITYDKSSMELTVSDMGFGGAGMNESVCYQIISDFYSHNFSTMDGISKFGLGRFYPFGILGSHPNMRFITSTGDGVMREVSCVVPDINKEVWERNVNEYPCEKGIANRGTKVRFSHVELSDEEIEEMKDYYSIHYALTKCKIIFNGEELEKFNPCYIEKLPGGIYAPDGIYSIDGFVFKVETHEFKYQESVVKFKLFALHITQRAFDEGFTNKKDSTSAINGGFYGCLGSNILNKGNNAKEFFDLIFTRGGSGVTRLFMKVIQDDDNILLLNDVKALGYAPFYARRFELDNFKNNNGEKLFDHVASVLKHCRKLYDRVGQDKHKGYTDEEIYKIAVETYNLGKNRVSQSKTLKTVKGASKDAHVQYIEQMYDYVTPSEQNNGIIKVSIPKNKVNTLDLEVNAQVLPFDWGSLTKEDILIAMAKFIIEEKKDSILFSEFNNSILKCIKHYDK